ncbi:MAG: type I-U CRISPR-associated helicase/endonuclease Cas3 [Planctomycetaceae bacterium]
MAFDFGEAFQKLTGNQPFPWQELLYQRFTGEQPGGIPSSCNLPTGLGKTSVVAVWLLALVQHPDRIPRRLVYVVNRRTVVDQTTAEVEKYRHRLQNEPALAAVNQSLFELFELNIGDENGIQDRQLASPLALSTLRGQFADNREWSANPARPAVIVGTVDMIGSRLLFSGYGVGFKGRPLHAGFLGQDVLLVHDEAHLEPAFQKLLTEIVCEQKRCNEFGKFHVMELSATSRGDKDVFSLTKKDRVCREVAKRFEAKKLLTLHKLDDEKKLADRIVECAIEKRTKDRTVLVFVRKVDDVEKIVKQLPKGTVQQLTGTLRGLERDRMADPRKKDGCPIFARFLKPPKPDADKSERWVIEPKGGTVYLVCTSAGEVGVNISADDMICDLSTFESMAQRFGRVNRFGERSDSEIHVFHPQEFDESDKLDNSRSRTLELLIQLNGDGSPRALNDLDPSERIEAFAPSPLVLPASEILFDAWALTTIRGKLPGRPPVEPYLHGISEWEPPETYVAWRDEVEIIKGNLVDRYQPADLLDDYPVKPHELLRDSSSRVFDRLKKLNAIPDTPVWIVSEDDTVKVTTLKGLIDAGKDDLASRMVLLPPSAGGLDNGLLTASSNTANDVADEFDENRQRRVRLRQSDPRLSDAQKTMRLIRTVDITSDSDEADRDVVEQQIWYWFEQPASGDSDGSRSSRLSVEWQVHTTDVTSRASAIVHRLPLSGDLQSAIILAAKFHDLGKRRVLWQRSIGNPVPTHWWAKSGTKTKGRELGDTYRHEFGSLVDVLDPQQPHLDELNGLSESMRELVLHLIAVHHGFARPHFPADHVFDPEPKGMDIEAIACCVPQRYARLQRVYGRWGLAYLESLLRAADYAASAQPSSFVEDVQ